MLRGGEASAVDATTEESIHEALRTETAGRTMLLVAHRRSTLHLADRIVVLERGRVAAQGTHDDLVVESAAYRALLTGLDDTEAHIVQAVLFGLGVLVMVAFVRAAQRIEPFTKRG